jgi:hypothetical protein
MVSVVPLSALNLHVGSPAFLSWQFSLIVGFWRLFFKREEFQILILGVDRAGKTVRLLCCALTVLSSPVLSSG